MSQALVGLWPSIGQRVVYRRSQRHPTIEEVRPRDLSRQLEEVGDRGRKAEADDCSSGGAGAVDRGVRWGIDSWRHASVGFRAGHARQLHRLQLRWREPAHVRQHRVWDHRVHGQRHRRHHVVLDRQPVGIPARLELQFPPVVPAVDPLGCRLHALVARRREVLLRSVLTTPVAGGLRRGAKRRSPPMSNDREQHARGCPYVVVKPLPGRERARGCR